MKNNKFTVIFTAFLTKINRKYINSTEGCKKNGYNQTFILYNKTVEYDKIFSEQGENFMNDCGQKIADLRKRHDLTQLELGNRLNVTAQAVSKWETGLSEPDIETLKKISALFNVSLDELLSNETAATVAEAPEKPVVKPQEKVIVAKCERCGKNVAAGEYSIAVKNHTERSGRTTSHYTTQHLYCNDCYKKYQEEERKKAVAETKRKAYAQKDEIDKSFRLGTIWGTVAAVAVAIGFIIAATQIQNFSPLAAAIIGVISCYGIFAMVFQCFFEGYVLDILDFFSRSFHLPGFIFTLDLEGIVWLITVKLSLSILFGILSAMIFAVGVIVATFCSLFTFPFALKNNFANRKAANAAAEKASALK